MTKLEVNLVSFWGERIVARHYSKEKMVTCLCGNPTPEKLYLANDCPHCHMGIGYEPDSEGSEERLAKLEKIL